MHEQLKFSLEQKIKTKLTSALRSNSSFIVDFQQGRRPSTKHGHVVSEYHQNTEPDTYLKAYDPPVLHGTPSSIPDYLKPKVAALTEESQRKVLLPRRPATAGRFISSINFLCQVKCLLCHIVCRICFVLD